MQLFSKIIPHMFSVLFAGMVSGVHSINISKMVTVAVASQAPYQRRAAEWTLLCLFSG